MARTRFAFTISLPQEIAVELERVQQEEHRSRSELVREALRRYFPHGPCS
ncbi:CopG family ribbon-helix-helix protein [Bradyrhizobium sp. CCGB20]